MQDVSTQALMIAISSTLMDRCRLLDRIAAVDPEVDHDEHLSEQVMDIDMALGELSSTYSARLQTEPMFPRFEELVANTQALWDSLR